MTDIASTTTTAKTTKPPVPKTFESEQLAEEKVWGTVKELRQKGFFTFTFEEVIQYNPQLPAGWIIRAAMQQ